jgi:hypothetical protein
MKFSRSNFKTQRFESRSPRLESWRISIPECGGSNPAAPTGQSVSNAYGRSGREDEPPFGVVVAGEGIGTIGVIGPVGGGEASSIAALGDRQ